jgi:hypothetical protein
MLHDALYVAINIADKCWNVITLSHIWSNNSEGCSRKRRLNAAKRKSTFQLDFILIYYNLTPPETFSRLLEPPLRPL